MDWSRRKTSRTFEIQCLSNQPTVLLRYGLCCSKSQRNFLKLCSRLVFTILSAESNLSIQNFRNLVGIKFRHTLHLIFSLWSQYLGFIFQFPTGIMMKTITLLMAIVASMLIHSTQAQTCFMHYTRGEACTSGSNKFTGITPILSIHNKSFRIPTLQVIKKTSREKKFGTIVVDDAISIVYPDYLVPFLLSMYIFVQCTRLWTNTITYLQALF